MNTFTKIALFVSIAIQAVSANKVVAYWGQNSAGNEGNLRDYCASPSIDIIVIGFVYQFPTAPGSAYPGVNFANHCWKTFDSANPLLLDCADSIGVDITYCQSLGKQVLLSFGGAVGPYGFTSDAQASAFANTVWDMFLGGSSSRRPFGTAIVDGVDLDIESGGPKGYVAFINQLRVKFAAQSSRTYYISGAPQCVYPDAMMGPGAGTALGDAWFDYVWIQFYNNYCGINYYPGSFNFNNWASWAATSKNPNVKLFIGAPGDQNSAEQGYVTADTLKIIDAAVKATYPSIYGGIMLWDAGVAKKNNDYAGQLASFVHSAASTPAASTPAKTPVVVTQPSTTAAAVVRPSTTAAAAVVKPSTTAAAPVPVAATTGRAKAPTPSTTAAAPTPASVNTGPCTDGYMKCTGSKSYQTCAHGSWGAVQNCASTLVCSPSGNYIYCTY